MRCPAVFLPTTLIDALGSAIAAPAVAGTYGVAAAGLFFLAHRLVLAPSALLSASVADAYHARLVAIGRADPQQVRRSLKSSARHLLAVAVAIYAPVAALAPLIVVPLLGAQWSALQFVLVALVPAAISGTVVSPLSRALMLSRVPQLRWISDCTRLLLPLAAILGAHRLDLTLDQALVAFAAATVIGDGVYLAVILYCAAPQRLRVA